MAGETALVAAVPALGLPVIHQLDDAVIGGLTDWLYSRICLVVDIEAIQLVNAEHQKAFDDASLKLKVIAEESGDDSPEYQDAKEKALVALSVFTHFIGQ